MMGPTGTYQMTGSENKPKSSARTASGMTQPGDLYFPGDALPQPEVVEKDTDSVWALWSGTVEEDSQAPAVHDKDFKDTVPMDFDEMAPTQFMDLPDLPNEPVKKR